MIAFTLPPREVFQFLSQASLQLTQDQKIILFHPPLLPMELAQVIQEIYRAVKDGFPWMGLDDLYVFRSINSKACSHYFWTVILLQKKQISHIFPFESSHQYLELTERILETYIQLHEYLAKKKHQLQTTAQKIGQSIYLPKQVTGWIRPLQITPHGHIFIHYNSLKTGDAFLGSGGNKEIKFAYNLTTHTYYASASIPEFPYQEIYFLNQFKGHPGFVQLVDVAAYLKNGIQKFRMLFEFCNGGALGDGLLKGMHRIHRKNIFEKLIPFVAYMHEKKLIHRDLKPNNIFLKSNENGLLDPVIGDLGAMCHVDDTDQKAQRATSATVLTPELARALISQSEEAIREATTSSLDDWGLGCILHHLTHMSPPLPWFMQGSDETAIIHSLASVQGEWLSEPEEKNSPQHLAWEMLQKRLPATEAVKRLNSLDWTKW